MNTFAAMLIVTSSPDPGTLSVLQFAAVSQLLSPPPPVQDTAESSVLGSIHSSCGRHDFDCFGLGFECDRNGSASMAMTSKTEGTRENKGLRAPRAQAVLDDFHWCHDPRRLVRLVRPVGG